MNGNDQIQFARLLAFRPLEQLSRMNNSDRASLLDEILAKGPSEASWLALWELFATWPATAEKTRHLDMAEQALGSWPDRLRSISSSSSLLYEGQQLSELARLAKTIEIYRREDRAPSELQAIASSRYSVGLTSLEIVRSEISSRSWRALVQSPNLPNLRHLHVSCSVLGSASIQQLLQSLQFSRLQCLKLIDVGIQPPDLETFQQGIPFPEVCAIDLSANIIGDKGATLLSKALWLGQISRMTLQRSFIYAEGIQRLLSSPLWKKLETLDLTGNQVTDVEKSKLRAAADSRNLRLII